MCLGLANGCRKPITKKRTYEKLKQTHFPEKNSGAELTREDVIKALECCSAGNCESGNCPLFSPGDIDVCTTKLATLALEIIRGDVEVKRALIAGQTTLQKHLAEKDSYINQLQNENEILHINADEAYQQGLDENRALFEKNIISEFWDKVKAKADTDKIITIDCRWAVSQNMGDKILKEMRGDES